MFKETSDPITKRASVSVDLQGFVLRLDPLDKSLLLWRHIKRGNEASDASLPKVQDQPANIKSIHISFTNDSVIFISATPPNNTKKGDIRISLLIHNLCGGIVLDPFPNTICEEIKMRSEAEGAPNNTKKDKKNVMYLSINNIYILGP